MHNSECVGEGGNVAVLGKGGVGGGEAHWLNCSRDHDQRQIGV
jgi:hypothetical protein